MTTFKGMIFPHHKKENGTIPAKIRIIHNREKKYIPTSIVFYPDQYTKAFKLKNCTPKFQLDDLERKYTEKIATLNVKDMSIEDIITFVTAEKKEGGVDFIQFWESELENISNKGSRRNYKTALNNLKSYTVRLTTDEIDYSFVKNYSKYILANNGVRANSLYLGSFRTIFFAARDKYNDEEVGIIRIPRNPFNKFKVPKQAKSENRALNIESLITIINLPDKGTRWNLSRDMFMFSFFTMGMNSVDIYRCEKPKSGRIVYERSKTKDRREDKALLIVEIQPEAKSILEKYKGSDLLFMFEKQYAGHEEFNTAINKGLKQIEKNLRDDFDKKIEKKEIHEDSEFDFEDLEFYAARHTWATFAQNSCGIDKYLVHECLNHAVKEMKTTDIYIEKDWGRINQANRVVLDKLATLISTK
jgi:integrase